MGSTNSIDIGKDPEIDWYFGLKFILGNFATLNLSY